ncbi:pentapeptide repeat-containing protein [Nostoc sp.]
MLTSHQQILTLANLSQTNLNQTNFTKANLTKANLTGAKYLISTNLHQVIITDAIMPDGKVHSKMSLWKQTGICLKSWTKNGFYNCFHGK